MSEMSIQLWTDASFVAEAIDGGWIDIYPRGKSHEAVTLFLRDNDIAEIDQSNQLLDRLLDAADRAKGFLAEKADRLDKGGLRVVEEEE